MGLRDNILALDPLRYRVGTSGTYDLAAQDNIWSDAPGPGTDSMDLPRMSPYQTTPFTFHTVARIHFGETSTSLAFMRLLNGPITAIVGTFTRTSVRATIIGGDSYSHSMDVVNAGVIAVTLVNDGLDSLLIYIDGSLVSTLPTPPSGVINRFTRDASFESLYTELHQAFYDKALTPAEIATIQYPETPVPFVWTGAGESEVALEGIWNGTAVDPLDIQITN